MSEPYIGQIMIVGFNFPPRGWTLCDGQTLSISQNQALFSLLGTTFGGDGRTTFGIPDLRGRSPVGVGGGPGLSPISWGQKAGAEEQVLTVNQLPSHHHNYKIDCNADTSTTDDPDGSYPGIANENIYASAKDASMAQMTTENTGNGTPFNIRNPFLGLYFCIALTGVYPSRN